MRVVRTAMHRVMRMPARRAVVGSVTAPAAVQAVAQAMVPRVAVRRPANAVAVAGAARAAVAPAEPASSAVNPKGEWLTPFPLLLAAGQARSYIAA